jgi:hypothetical protein
MQGNSEIRTIWITGQECSHLLTVHVSVCIRGDRRIPETISGKKAISHVLTPLGVKITRATDAQAKLNLDRPVAALSTQNMS